MPAAKLGRLAIQERRVETDGFHEFLGALSTLAAPESGEFPERPDDCVAYRQLGIERRGRVLKHHPHSGALVFRAVEDVGF